MYKQLRRPCYLHDNKHFVWLRWLCPRWVLTAFPTSPVGSVCVIAVIIKPRDPSCYLEQLVKEPSLTGESAAMQEELFGCERISLTARATFWINSLSKLHWFCIFAMYEQMAYFTILPPVECCWYQNLNNSIEWWLFSLSGDEKKSSHLKKSQFSLV